MKPKALNGRNPLIPPQSYRAYYFLRSKLGNGNVPTAGQQTSLTAFTLIAPEYQKAVDAANALAKADSEKKIPDL